MTRRMTMISLPGSGGTGFMDDGVVPAEKMIEDFRVRMLRMKQQAEEALDALDVDFRIEVVDGVHVRRRVKLVQEGRKWN